MCMSVIDHRCCQNVVRTKMMNIQDFDFLDLRSSTKQIYNSIVSIIALT